MWHNLLLAFLIVSDVLMLADHVRELHKRTTMQNAISLFWLVLFMFVTITVW